MYHQRDTELLFPARVIPTLRDSRDRSWQVLVDTVCAQAEDSLDGLSFSLMMIRLDGCLTCHAGSHRAMLGCTTCAGRTIKLYKGTDADLLTEFCQAREDVQAHLESNT